MSYDIQNIIEVVRNANGRTRYSLDLAIQAGSVLNDFQATDTLPGGWTHSNVADGYQDLVTSIDTQLSNSAEALFGRDQLGYNIYFNDSGDAVIVFSQPRYEGLYLNDSNLTDTDFLYASQLMIEIYTEFEARGFSGNVLYAGNGVGGMFANMAAVASHELYRVGDVNAMAFNGITPDLNHITNFLNYTWNNNSSLTSLLFHGSAAADLMTDAQRMAINFTNVPDGLVEFSDEQNAALFGEGDYATYYDGSEFARKELFADEIKSVTELKGYYDNLKDGIEVYSRLFNFLGVSARATAKSNPIGWALDQVIDMLPGIHQSLVELDLLNLAVAGKITFSTSGAPIIDVSASASPYDYKALASIFANLDEVRATFEQVDGVLEAGTGYRLADVLGIGGLMSDPVGSMLAQTTSSFYNFSQTQFNDRFSTTIAGELPSGQYGNGSVIDRDLISELVGDYTDYILENGYAPDEMISGAPGRTAVDVVYDFLATLDGDASAVIAFNQGPGGQKYRELFEAMKNGLPLSTFYAVADITCFAAGTQILMANGTHKPIEDIRAGDLVAAFPEKSSSTDTPLETARVSRTFKTERQRVVSLGGTLVTESHEFLCADGQFRKIADIDERGLLVDANGQAIKIPKIEPVEELVDVYNFEVEHCHTYVADGFRVHNECSSDRIVHNYADGSSAIIHTIGYGHFTIDYIVDGKRVEQQTFTEDFSVQQVWDAYEDFTGEPVLDEHGTWISRHETREIVTQVIDGEQRVIDRIELAGDLGGLFGSTLGNHLGNNAFERIAGSAVLGTVTRNLAEVAWEAIDHDLTVLKPVYEDALSDFPEELRDAGVGALSAYLTAQLVDAIGLDGLAGEFANSVGGTLIGQISKNIASNVNPFTGVDPTGLAVAGALGSLIGSKLAGAIWTPTSTQGQIGMSVGAGVGGILATFIFDMGKDWLLNFAVPGLGALVGSIAGSFVGSLIAGTAESGVHVIWDPELQRYRVLEGWEHDSGNENPTTEYTFNQATNEFERTSGTPIENWRDDGAMGDEATLMAEAAAAMFNGAFNALTDSGITVLNPEVVGNGAWGRHGDENDRVTYRYWYDGENSHDIAEGKDGPFQESLSPVTTNMHTAISTGTGYNFSNMSLVGGDIFVRRAFYANLKNFEFGNTGTYDATSMIGDLTVGSWFSYYTDHVEEVGALVMANAESQYAFDWALALTRALELGLADRQKSDFFGGLQSALQYERVYGSRLIDNGTTFADVQIGLADVDGDGTVDLELAFRDQMFTIQFDDFANTMGYNEGSSSIHSDIRIASSDTAVNYSDLATSGPSAGPLDSNGKSLTSDDIFVGAGGNDTLAGGYGWDWLDGNGGDDKITGGDGRDVLLGRDGADMLDGGTGNDTLADGAGADTVKGDAGDDVILVAQDGDADVLDGEGGSDTASYEDWTTGISITMGSNVLGDTHASIENITGTQFEDDVNGDTGANVLKGLAGYDFLAGGAGNDTLEGGAGEDTLEGGDGIDTASYASATGGVLVDIGDDGNNAHGDAKGDVLTDIENLTGSSYGDTLRGNGGANRIDGAGGDDVFEGSGGSDTLIGGAGFDVVDYGASGSGVTVNLISGAGAGGAAAGDRYDGIEGVRGSAQADTLTLSNEGGLLDGKGGDDQLAGGSGSDVFLLATDGGTDTVTTGGGQDVFLLDSGIEFRDLTVTHYNTSNNSGVRVSAGAGTLGVQGGAGFGDVVQVQNADGLTIDVEGVKTIKSFSGGNDSFELTHDQSTWIDGGSGNDVITTGAGHDILVGGAGNDTLNGGFRDDTYIFRIGDGQDVIYDGFGRDRLIIEGDVTKDDLSFRWVTKNGTRMVEMSIGDGPNTIVFADWTKEKEQGRIETLIIGGEAVDLTALARQTLSNIAPTAGVGNSFTFASNFTGLPESTFMGSVAGSDPDGDILTYEIVGVQDPLDGVNFWIEGTAIMSDIDQLNVLDHQVTLSVVANDGMADSSPFNVTLRFEQAQNTTHGNTFKYPVVLDLDGDGVELIALNDGRVMFDIDEDGEEEVTGWFGPDDGVLVYDENDNGIVDDAGEISFAQYTDQLSDILGLRYFDTSDNNKLDSGDEEFGKFFIWQDINSDGITDAGELRSLDYWGIQSIDLDPTYTGITVFGQRDNTISAYSDFTWADGTKGTAGDVAFFYSDDVNRGIEMFLEEGGGPGLGTEYNDTIHGSQGDDEIKGYQGDDLLYGNGGEDVIIADHNTNDIGQDTVYGGTGKDWISALSGNDVIYGGDGADYILAAEGADTIFGGDGSDVILGDEGRLYGEDGDDVLNGGYYMYGGNGDDTLVSDGDVAQLWGDAGSDLFRWRDVGAARTVTINDFEFGVDKIDISEANIRYEDLSFSGGYITANYTNRNGHSEVLSIRLRNSGGILPDESAFIIDTKDPVLTVAAQYYQGQSPTFVGHVDDVNDVTLYVTIAGKLYETQADADGNWAVTVEDSLADGVYAVSVLAEDRYGNTADYSSDEALTIDNIPPTVTLDPAHSNDTTPLLSGTIDEPDATLEITIGGITHAAVNNGDGTWSLEWPEDMAEGFHDVRLVATDPAGNVTDMTLTGGLQSDYTAPTGTQDYLATDDTTPVLTGTVDDPTATIEVTIGSVQSRRPTVYTAENLGDGTWRLQVPDALAHGDYDVNVRFTDGAGNWTVASNIASEFVAIPEAFQPISGGWHDMAFGDLNNNGFMDAIANNKNNDNGFIRLTADEDFEFDQKGSIGLGESDYSPEFFDLDGDGYLDIVFGDGSGSIKWRENEKEEETDVSWANKAGLGIDVGTQARIGYGDLDGDGDYDLIAANNEGDVFFIRNDGTAQAPSFVLVDDASSPVHNLVVGNKADPDLFDIDGDGDLDLFLVDHDGVMTFLRNDGDASTPVFVAADNPLSWVDLSFKMDIEFGDLDFDGDLDLIVERSPNGDIPTTSYEAAVHGLRVDTQGPSVAVDALTTNDATPTLTGSVTDPTATVTVTIGAESHDAVNNGDGTWSLDWPSVLSDGSHAVEVSATDVYGNTTTQQLGVAQFTKTLNEGDQPIELDGGEDPQVALVDIDGDGDLDLFSGRYDSNGEEEKITFYRNDGTATAPNFVEVTGDENPLNSFKYYKSTPAFGDFDGDGDLDLLVGGSSIVYGLENIGTAQAPEFVQQERNHEWIDGEPTGSRPVFVDIDADGDLDAYLQARNTTAGGSHFQLNVGSVTDPLFGEVAGTPAADLILEDGQVAAFADYDGDGDLDAFSIESSDIVLHENTGTVDAPQFVLADDSKNPFAGLNVYARSLALGDINGDGVLDAVVGSALGDNAVIYWGQAHESAGLTIDTAVAGTTFTALATTDNTPLLTGTIDDPAATIEVEVLGVRYAVENPGDGTWQIELPNAIGDGVHDVTLHTVDPWGNVGAETFAGALDISGNPPLVTLDTPDNETRTPFLSGTVDDAAASVVVKIDGVAHDAVNHGDGTWSYQVTTPLGDGRYDIGVEATDADGVIGRNHSPMVGVTRNTDILSGFVNTARAIPAFADLDGDGDLDVVIADFASGMRYLRNDGGTYSELTAAGNPFDGIDHSGTEPTLTDLDGDGDYDLVVGTAVKGELFTYWNEGTSSSPSFVRASAGTDPFDDLAGLEDREWAPAFIDIDADGDLDLVAGETYGGLKLFENTGSDTIPNFVKVSGTASPFNGMDFDSHSSVAFSDIDNDGDYDFVVGASSGNGEIRFYLNEGTAEEASFVAAAGDNNPYAGLDYLPSSNPNNVTPTFADADGDGDDDLVFGYSNGGQASLHVIETETDELVIDGSAPAVTFEEVETSDATPVLTGTVDDPDVTIVVTIGDTSFDAVNNGDGTWTAAITQDLAVGSYTVQVVATNWDGVTGSTIPNYSTAEVTGADALFDGVDVGNRAGPALADIDGDGDLDVFVGEEDGEIFFFRNDGTAGAPNYVAVTGSDNPFNGVDLGNNSYLKPVFVDLDLDGDLDALVGSDDGTYYFRNDGSSGAADFTQVNLNQSPITGSRGDRATFTFGDLDNDGDLDALYGQLDGQIRYLENEGGILSSASNGSLNGVDVGSMSAVALYDIDGDGDLDLLVGESNYKINYFRNDGTPEAPIFDEITNSNNPLKNADNWGDAVPVVTDINGDGIPDFIIGELDGEIKTFLSTADGDDLVITAANTLEGVAGDDTLKGTSESDIFTYGADWGNDVAKSFTPGADVIDLSATSLQYANLTITQEGADTRVSDGINAILLVGVTASDLSQSDFAFSESTVTEITGTSGNDTLTGTADDDLIEGHEGNDVLSGGAGADTLRGGEGHDTARYNTSPAGVAVNLATGVGTGGDAEGDVLSGIEQIYASAHADTLTGGTGNEVLNAATGDDQVFGQGGNDKLIGGGGNDTVEGGSGNDTLFGIDGEDVLRGGDGDDTLFDNREPTSNTTPIPDGGDVLDGGAGNDYLYATDGDDTLTGGAGHDRIFGGESADRIYGGTDNDQIEGGDGADVMYGEAGHDTIRGGIGGDYLKGHDGNDLLEGGADNDQLYGDGDADTLRGGDGNDVLHGGDGSDKLYGEDGNDLINTDAGGDYVDAGAGADTVNGGTGADTLGGGTGADRILGGAGNDVIAGGDDADALYGEDGNDTLRGDLGGDYLKGNDGTDLLEGGAGNDQLFGDAGADTLIGGDGNDRMTGGTGDDSFAFGAGWGEDTVFDFTSGEDKIDLSATSLQFGDLTITQVSADTQITDGSGNTITLTGVTATDISASDFVFAASANVITGTSGADTLTGTADDDLIEGHEGNDQLYGDAGADTLRGGDGQDYVNAAAGDDQVFGEGGNDKLIGGVGNDTVEGGSGNDTLFGIDGEDVLRGGDGNDTLFDNREPTSSTTPIPDGGDVLDGGAGNDYLYATDGDDTLTGGTGADTLIGGEGADRLDGGADYDRAVYTSAAAGVVVDLADTGLNTGDAAGDVYTSIEEISGSELADTLSGDEAANVLVGQGGDDVIHGRGGNDYLAPQEGNDTVYGGTGNDTLNGKEGSDYLVGEDGHDRLNGGGDADTLQGGIGNDTLIGGYGSNSLDGGDGNDSMLGGGDAETLIGGAGDDTIHGQNGNDVITGGSGNDVFYYDTSRWHDDVITDFTSGEDVLDLSGTAHQFGDLTITQEGADTRISAGADYTITLTGVTATDISASDFVFASSANVIVGTNSADTLVGTGSADTLYGLEGGDQLHGGAGNDLLEAGGSGINNLWGGAGDDTIRGGDGIDIIYEDTGADLIDGGAGYDRVDYLNATEALSVNLATGVTSGAAAGDVYVNMERILGTNYDDTIVGGAGFLNLTGREGNDLITGGDGTDTIQGSEGNDTIDGGLSNDRLVAGSGNDVVRFGANWGNDTFDDFTQGEDVIDFSALGASFTYADLTIVDSGASNTLISDTNGNSILVKNIAAASFSESDFVFAANVVTGTSGADTLTGTADDDLIEGHEGNDQLYGDAGADTLRGGDGQDYVNAAAGDDQIFGQSGNDKLIGGTGNDTVEGGSGNDTLFGIDGEDVLRGGDGDDTLFDNREPTSNTTPIPDGGDVLEGGAGNDYLYATDGDDTLTGGAGTDTLHGGDGSDVVRFGASWGNDTFDDFTQGEDVIDFSALGAGFTYADLTIVDSGASNTLISDTNGNSILVKNIAAASFSESDFVFAGGGSSKAAIDAPQVAADAVLAELSQEMAVDTLVPDQSGAAAGADLLGAAERQALAQFTQAMASFSADSRGAHFEEKWSNSEREGVPFFLTVSGSI